MGDEQTGTLSLKVLMSGQTCGLKLRWRASACVFPSHQLSQISWHSLLSLGTVFHKGYQIFSKGCSSPGPGNGFTTKRPKGPTQMLPCLGWELEKAWTRCPMEERGPAGRRGRKRCVSPWGALPSSHCHPQCRRKGERPRERSVAWGRQRPRYLVGPGVVHREGQGAGMRGAASVEERAAG